MELKITIITLGHVDKQIDIRRIKSWKSKLFKIASVQRLDHLPESDVNDGYFDHKFSKDALSQHVKCPVASDLAIVLIPNRFENNFYIQRLTDNCAAISLYGINDIIATKSISMENFVLKQIFELCVLKKLLNSFESEEAYKIIHTDTRGCLFDMNGDRRDIIYNIERPIICESCVATIKGKQLEDNYLKRLKKELKYIRKPRLLSIESFIKKYPLLAVLMSALLAVFLNLISNMVFEKIK